VDLGSHRNDDSQQGLYSRAEQYARRAVALNPNDAEGHFAMARALGKTALSQSPKGRIKYATDIRNQALECLRLNPKHAGCLHVMGMWNAEVMRLNGFTRMIAKNFLGGKVFGSANWNEAVRYMEASVANDPDRIVHRVDLAQIYVDLKQPDKARAMAEAALRLPVSDYNDDLYKAEARALLSKI
jgi:tetratricopeptide (TPR) repeat protein